MVLKDEVAASWAETLAGLLPGQRVYAGRRDEGVRPPFTVVVVKRLVKTEGHLRRFYAPVRIVHVSEVADSTSVEHNARIKAIAAALDVFPERGVDAVRGVCLDGWELDEVEDAIDKESDVFGDVFIISAGVGGVASPTV